MIGLVKIFLATEKTSLNRSLLMDIGSPELFMLRVLVPNSTLVRLFPISIKTKLMGFKMARLIGAIKYKYEAYSGCVVLYNASTIG